MALNAQLLASAPAAPGAVASAITLPAGQLAYTVAGAVQATGGAMTRTGLYREVREGRLQIRKCGRRTMILAEDLRRFLEALPTTG
jgi:hypothetical protein